MSVSLVSLEPAQCQAHREDRRESLSTAFTEGWEPKTCFPRELQTMPFSSPAFVCSQVTGCVSCWGFLESVWVPEPSSMQGHITRAEAWFGTNIGQGMACKLGVL